VTTTPPLICIEILSPEDRLTRARIVLGDYLAMGVQNLWLIDPIRASPTLKFRGMKLDAAGLHIADTSSLTVPNTPIHLDLTDFFEKLDKKLGINS
jgi:Uma2 family endonuclease